MRRIAALALLAGQLMAPGSAAAAENRWSEIRSPHFRVLSDGDERAARLAARRLEEIRAAFAIGFPNLRLNAPVPLLILAPRNEDSLDTVLPEMSRTRAVKPGGFFTTGSEKAFAVIRLDLEQQSTPARAGGYRVIYHEYTHSVLNANFRWLPLWLNEGLAEFFGNTEFDGDKIYLGGANIRAEYTRGRPLLPLEKLMEITTASKEYQDADSVQVFYSQSWALVHLLLVSPEMERGRRLQQFLSQLEKGVAQPDAFRQAIGDSKSVEQQLRRYMEMKSLEGLTSTNPTPVAEESFSLRELKDAERDAELGTVEVWLHEDAAAKTRLERALKEDPQSGLAAEAMAFLRFAEGRDAAALSLFERAVQNNSSLYLAAYYRAMMSAPPARSEQLRIITQSNPDFAPAHAQLARIELREGNPAAALPFALKAQQLWPSKGGYHLLIGEILHALGRDAEAAGVARYVADRWPELERDAARELWQKLPAAVRQGGELPFRKLVEKAAVIRGRVMSAECNEKRDTMGLVVEDRPLTLRVRDERLAIGVADTLWYAADHFDRCHHIAGHDAVIQYLPRSGSGGDGELLRLDVYDR